MNYLIYHNDPDGKMSAAIVRYHEHIPFRLVPMTHGWRLSPDIFTDTIGKVYILDFTLEKPFMEYVVKRASQVIWIDHHSDSIKACPEFAHLEGLRAEGSPAACQLTYRYFHPDVEWREQPRAVRFIGDSDTKTHAYPESRPFRTYIHHMSPRVDDYMEMLSDDIDLNLHFGKLLLSTERRSNETLLRKVAFRANHQGYPVVCTNRRVSPFFFEGWQPDDTQAFISWEQLGTNLCVLTAYRTEWANIQDLRQAFNNPQYAGHAGACGITGESVRFTAARELVVVNPKTGPR